MTAGESSGLGLQGGSVPLWLDCDPGHDDAFAILLAAHHPSLNLLGISTVHGNGSLENTTVNALSILEAIGRTDVPVHPGAKKPFCRTAIHAPDIHGESGLDGTDLLPSPKKPAIRDPSAIVAMRNALLSQPKDTAWVVATGTLTNVALLFATFPEVAEHVKGLSIMGGAIGEGFAAVPISKKPGDENRIGNTTPWAEFNIYCDPEAAQSILSSPVIGPKTTMTTIDLTHQVFATSKVQSLILQTETEPSGGLASTSNKPTVLRQILHALLLFFANTYDAVYGLDTGPPLHDPVAVAVLLSNLNLPQDSAELQFDDRNQERFLVNVVTDGIHGNDLVLTGQLGRTVAKAVADPKAGGVTIPRGVDTDKFWELILDCLRRADKCNAERNGG